MFGDPEAAVSPVFCVLSEIDRVVQRRLGIAARADR
jgi:hypothetical protein